MDKKLFLKKFNKLIEENFDEFLLSKVFKLISYNVKEHTSERVYIKNKQYVVIHANMNPQDIPNYWNIVLGEGSREFPETDWNKVVLWRFMRTLGQKDAGEYLISNLDVNKLNEQVRSARNDLQNYGNTFLEGDLDLFYKVRSLMNKEREPYKIYTPDKGGNYQVSNDSVSEKLKKEFGG
jgi:hypothetical protein